MRLLVQLSCFDLRAACRGACIAPVDKGYGRLCYMRFIPSGHASQRRHVHDVFALRTITLAAFLIVHESPDDSGVSSARLFDVDKRVFLADLAGFLFAAHDLGEFSERRENLHRITFSLRLG